MDAAFGAVHVAIGFLEIKLSSDIKLCSHPVLKVEQIVNYLCNQCEVSLQFLQLMCQQKKFRERMLRNKVLPFLSVLDKVIYCELYICHSLTVTRKKM